MEDKHWHREQIRVAFWLGSALRLCFVAGGHDCFGFQEHDSLQGFFWGGVMESCEKGMAEASAVKLCAKSAQ